MGERKRKLLPDWCVTHNDVMTRRANCCSMGGYYGEWDDCVRVQRFAVIEGAQQ